MPLNVLIETMMHHFALAIGARTYHLSLPFQCFDFLRERSVSYYSPQLIQTMRHALETVMTYVPLGHATPGVKAHLAEIILQAAAHGVTSHDGLVAVASAQIQTIISMLA